MGVKKLKLKKKHPNKQFRLQGHLIGYVAQDFELSDAEEKELQSAGCQAWIEVVGEEPAKKVKGKK